MKSIKIGLIALVFSFFVPTNGHAIVRQATEMPYPERHTMSLEVKGRLIVGVIFLALGIYPFVNGIAMYCMPTNLLAPAVGVLVGAIGGILLIVGLMFLISYFREKYR
jgi:hypothetical protein